MRACRPDRPGNSRFFANGEVQSPAILTPEQLREAARSFSADTACPDGVVIRWLALLSNAALRALGRLQNKKFYPSSYPNQQAVCDPLLFFGPLPGCAHVLESRLFRRGKQQRPPRSVIRLAAGISPMQRGERKSVSLLRKREPRELS